MNASKSRLGLRTFWVTMLLGFLSLQTIHGQVVCPIPSQLISGGTFTTKLKWTGANTSCPYYEVQVATDAAFSNLITVSYPSITSDSATVTIPSAGTYYWRVHTFYNSTYSAWSAVQSFVVPPTP